ncbi:DUF1659 domain-containing protein [Clostridiaceae bacterium UIB06]|uniref:DUF1659 domain-containing protein n=1 Tax=Clostridium thailandense TaxID=2794346 RepID=A0A949TUK5_9CLOT|nr:DUF1659 domain-containing protein [Clostridium thailandense]MBV7273746.1 DUF1659 domain-containing protein [Clostridium thailandense]MCH5137474.1 DUF1659 domain-containing protein [Clostridiaceae bacterium UIB06]
MAATATKLQTTLIIKYKDGVDAKGKEKIKSQNFKKVKTTAAEQDLYDVSIEIGKLLGKTLDEVVREDQSGIMNA